MPFTASTARDARRIKASNFALKVARRTAQNKLKMSAERWVQMAMKNGLEWAVKNPRTFLAEGGAIVDGSSLNEQEQEAVEQVLQSLLDRLVTNKLLLWKGSPGKPKGRMNNATLERLAAEAGARRGW